MTKHEMPSTTKVNVEWVDGDVAAAVLRDIDDSAMTLLDHLTDSDLAALVLGRMDDSEEERANWHLMTCKRCRSEAASLKEFLEESRRPSVLDKLGAGAGHWGVLGAMAATLFLMVGMNWFLERSHLPSAQGSGSLSDLTQTPGIPDPSSPGFPGPTGREVSVRGGGWTAWQHCLDTSSSPIEECPCGVAFRL